MAEVALPGCTHFHISCHCHSETKTSCLIGCPAKEAGMQDYRLDAIEQLERHLAAIERLIGPGQTRDDIRRCNVYHGPRDDYHAY
jgi:hypothetical protein